MKPKAPKKRDPKPSAKSGEVNMKNQCDCAICTNTKYPSIGYCKKFNAIFGSYEIKF